MRTLFLLTLFILFTNCEKEQPHSFKVMAWNILHGANDISNGKENAIAIIKEIDPDVILMVETYGSGKYIADALGYNFHLIAPKETPLNDKGTNLSIFSKYPFGDRIDTEYPFYLGGREIIINNQKIRFLSNWFHYLPWNDAPENMGKTSEELLEWEKTGTRFNMVQNVLPYLKKYAKDTDAVPLIFGGDMNTPSHLDWGENTKTIHNNLVVPWQTTKELENLGLIDTYRSLNPNPLTHPGITWDSEGEVDEHRIDYIFYKGEKIRPIKSETYNAFFNKPITVNGSKVLYPSDHGIVVTTFQFN
ncbi:endonuclease/exonuclease/phosphatase family protein [Hwangdonia lutea]|uniref:Endonuclease/exonuclease/phosphatase family protein n=1 Tax=Hwangdonia lutea TaxID=3075823 RepID=A0AA97HP35_9FLAO|nr:endonuclease/exonuclease/phosphatase family protein [Hwangdonia sp. SCSIO 19198]WOD42646.1 endonuclease/exonuclease/phosphatase family protein [Hwangdonia sp. SCSIO 19198]